MSADLSRPRSFVSVEGLRGTIVRSSIVGADGVERRDVKATWFQGLSLYVDLRQPIERPFERTAQDAFGGRCTTDADGVTTWERLFGLQPAGPHPDAGRLSWEGNVLLEHGVHEAYVEYWHPDEGAVREPAAGLLLGDLVTSSSGILIRVGDRFGWGRAGSQRESGLDTEVSLGRVDGAGRWIVEASSIPGREGTDLAPAPANGGWLVADLASDPTSDARFWRVDFAEGDTEGLRRPGKGA